MGEIEGIIIDMKTLFLLCAIGMIFTSYECLAKDAASSISKELIFKAIHTFRADPTAPEAQAAARLIKDFAENSADVRVTITKKAVPLISHHELPLSVTGPLTAAFLVGNVRSQLQHNKNTDDGYAGGLQVIETYRQLQRKHPGLQITAIEKFVELEKAGKLKVYLSTP